MTTYTATRSQLTQALATCLDWDTIKATGEYDSFASLVDAVLASGHLNVMPDAPRLPRQSVVSGRKILSASLLDAAQVAGAALGARREDAFGELPRAVTRHGAAL